MTANGATTARRGAGRNATAPHEAVRAYETTALVLQGGGALGAYQCGVYEGLHEAGIEPEWFAGTSIGAIHAAILAGNPPHLRLERLRTFWNRVCEPAGLFGWPLDMLARSAAWLPPNGPLRAWMGALGAFAALAHGQRGFFTPNPVPPFLMPKGDPAATSFYDTTPLRETLEELVDFRAIGRNGTRLSVGAVNVRTGNVRYFDSAKEAIRVEHVLASAALPPAFPAVMVDGDPWWDGGLVSNTPLDHVLEARPRHDSLVFQVDLWSARGEVPTTLMDVLERQKDIQYSSRTRFGTDSVARVRKLSNALARLAAELPGGALPASVAAELEPWMCDRVFNIVHLIHQAKPHEEQYKDYAFGPAAMREHWRAGCDDMRATLAHAEFFAMPDRALGVVTHDIHRHFATRGRDA